MPEARDQVIVDHSDGLHVGVNYRGPHELEASFLEIFTEGIRYFGGRRNFRWGFDLVIDRTAADETPKVRVKIAKLLLDIQKQSRIVNNRFDFQAIANDARVLH